MVLFKSNSKKKAGGDKKCPDCLGIVPNGAKKCKHCGADVRNWARRHPIISFIIFLLLFGSLMNLFDDSYTSTGVVTSRVSQPVTSSVEVGDTAILYVDDTDNWYVAVNQDAFKEFTKVAVASDTIGMFNMVASGRLFAVPVGTKVQVIDSTFTAREIRILEGEMFGKSGWVAFEFLK